MTSPRALFCSQLVSCHPAGSICFPEQQPITHCGVDRYKTVPALCARRPAATISLLGLFVASLVMPRRPLLGIDSAHERRALGGSTSSFLPLIHVLGPGPEGPRREPPRRGQIGFKYPVKKFWQSSDSSAKARSVERNRHEAPPHRAVRLREACKVISNRKSGFSYEQDVHAGARAMRCLLRTNIGDMPEETALSNGSRSAK